MQPSSQPHKEGGAPAWRNFLIKLWIHIIIAVGSHIKFKVTQLWYQSNIDDTGAAALNLINL
jgi:hypothetical protein